MARPKKSDSELHQNRINLYLTEDDDIFLRQLAARKGIPPGVLARALVVSKLEQLSISMVGNVNASLKL